MCVSGSIVCAEPVTVTGEGESTLRDSRRVSLSSTVMLFNIYLLGFNIKAFGV